jgi:hypothetical protein
MEQTSSFGILRANAGLIALLALLSASLLIAWQISGQTQASPAVSALKVEIEPLSFFVGQWDCDGEFVASKKPIASHIAIAADLDGSWLVFRWDDGPPNQYHALELWGFDKTAKHFTNFTHDNFGGVRLFQSPGWDGDTLIWTGDALTTPITLSQRFVIERKPNKQFIISWQVRKGESDWTTGDRLTCRQ